MFQCPTALTPGRFVSYYFIGEVYNRLKLYVHLYLYFRVLDKFEFPHWGSKNRPNLKVYVSLINVVFKLLGRL